MSLLTTMTAIFEYKLLFLLFGFGIGIVQGQPTITPSGDEHIITAGTDFVLTCRSNSPITWTYPSLKSNNNSLEPDVEISYFGSYSSKLTIRNPDDLAVGYYFCNGSDGRYASTYIYVDENERLFVGREEIIVAMGKQYSALIIPCRPTSPDVTVKLYEGIGTGDEMSREYQLGFEQDGTRWDFDPRVGFLWDYPDAAKVLVKLHEFEDNGASWSHDPRKGFILSNITWHSSTDYYVCTFDKGNKSVNTSVTCDVMMTYELYDAKIGFLLTEIQKGYEYYSCEFTKRNISVQSLVIAEQPQVYTYISQPLVSRPDGEIYHVEHENLTLKCEVEVEQSQPAHFSWLHRGKKIDVNENERRKYTITNNEIPSPSSYLTIYNISKETDSGNYTCEVRDDDNHSSQSFDIEILTKETHFLHLSENNDLTVVFCNESCSSVRWNINVTSFPKPNITWYNNLNAVIQTNSKYNITNRKQESLLEIKNVTVNDRGNYTIRVHNGHAPKRFSVVLEVIAAPKVSINRSNFHLPNQEDTVKCMVAAYPKPEIQWCFKPKDSADCSHEQIKSSETEEELMFVSTATLKKDESGQIECFAKNNLGEDRQITDYTVSDIKEGFGLVITEDNNELPDSRFSTVRLAEGDYVTFECGITLANYTNITWTVNDTLLIYIERLEETTRKTDYSTYKTITIKNVDVSDAGIYKCEATKRQGKPDVKKMRVTVVEPQAPKITSTNMGGERAVIFPIGINFTCKYEGVPFPTISWYKNGEEIFDGDNDRIVFSDHRQVLEFRKTEQSDEGEYKCQVRNRKNVVEKLTSIIISNKQEANSGTVYIVLAVFAVLFLIVCIGLIVKIRKERKLEKVLRMAGLQNFEKGQVESINPDLGIDDQAELLPYDKDSWEIPREQIKLGKQLGAGAFGVVMKAELQRYLNNEIPLAVAVKMIKKTADDTYLRALVSELKIMVHLGKHVNVVNLIGACTKHIVKRELYVVVEFCRFGNLHNYLLRHRENFINQIDPESGKIDYVIGADILSRSFSISSNHSQEGPPKEMMDYRSNSNCTGPMQTTEVTLVSMSPTGGQGDEVLLSNNSSTQPEWRSNYKGDYKGNVKPICTKDLLSWAFQVSRGMEYLSSRKVLHGDLAARNILLADNNVVKICDFGLAKSMYKSGNYKKKGDGPLPIKWMSVESIRDKVFSTQSDVWSYGIVLWEFFSLAKTPYPGMEADERLFQKLVDGYRMDAPTYATKDIYMLMLSCWEPKPQDRPSFEKLTDRIGNLLEDTVKRHYIDLNDPYLVMNTERFQSGQNDYLKMVSPPDFDKLSSPNYMNELPPMPMSAASNYMPMKSGNIFSPRQSDGQVFTFSDLNDKDPSAANAPELTPMLRHDSDYETQPNTPKSPGLPSYANPMYNKIDFMKDKNIIVNIPDNYVNMPKNKSAIKSDKDDFVRDESHYVNNVSRDWEKVQ